MNIYNCTNKNELLLIGFTHSKKTRCLSSVSLIVRHGWPIHLFLERNWDSDHLFIWIWNKHLHRNSIRCKETCISLPHTHSPSSVVSWDAVKSVLLYIQSDSTMSSYDSGRREWDFKINTFIPHDHTNTKRNAYQCLCGPEWDLAFHLHQDWYSLCQESLSINSSQCIKVNGMYQIHGTHLCARLIPHPRLQSHAEASASIFGVEHTNIPPCPHMTLHLYNSEALISR